MAQFSFSLRFRVRFFLSFQGSTIKDNKYSCFKLKMILYISGMKGAQVCMPLAHGGGGGGGVGVRRWRSATAAGGVGPARTQRVVDALRYIPRLI